MIASALAGRSGSGVCNVVCEGSEAGRLTEMVSVRNRLEGALRKVGRGAASPLGLLTPRVAAWMVVAGLGATRSVAMAGEIRALLVAIVLGGVWYSAWPRQRPLAEGKGVRCRLPFEGRWVAVNTPAHRVPSHLVHSYGQTYAFDFVRDVDYGGAEGRGIARRLIGIRQPGRYASFGEPIMSPNDGMVVAVDVGQRDHLSRSSRVWLPLLLLEGFIREAAGPRRVIGNHIILRLNDGSYMALGHLKRNSCRVRVGQHVRAGERIAECGNSGNSSQPHLHIQAMDAASLVFSRGKPLRFEGYTLDEGLATASGIPARGQVISADPTCA